MSTEPAAVQSLFVKTNVPLERVISAKLVIGFSGYKPYQRLVVTIMENDGENEITINPGWFDRSQLKSWLDALNLKLKSRSVQTQ